MKNKEDHNKKHLVLKWLKFPKEIQFQYGGKLRQGSFLIYLDSYTNWKRFVPLRKKVLCILKRKWTPEKEHIKINVIEHLIEEFLGEEEDFASCLFELLEWHYSLDVELNHLSEKDLIMFKGLESSSGLCRRQFRKVHSNPTMNLGLATKNPKICLLITPMVVKIPVRSVKNFLDIDTAFAFDRIRKSKHKFADDIIAYLNEILLIQQKTADSILNYLDLISKNKKEKGNSTLTRYELDAIGIADKLIPYLKATIEKAMQILALTHGLSIDNQKQHKHRLKKLQNELPESVKEQFYISFVLEQISSESLEELNKIRSGLLHKKGIYSLQPQSIVNEIEQNNLFENWLFAKKYHEKNTLMLLCVLSGLTDELVRLDPPSDSEASFPFECSIGFVQKFSSLDQT